MTAPLLTDEFLRKLERLALAAKRRAGGGAGAAGRGGRVEFADHRPYAPGDELRYVDWHLYARTGGLFVKEFAKEEQAEVLVVLDVSQSMAAKHEAAIRFAAALLVVALARGDRARFATAAGGELRLTKTFEGAARRGEALAALKAAERPAGRGTDLDRSLALLPPGAGGAGRLLILVSDLFADADGRRALAARRGETIVFHWLAPDDRAPPPYGRVRLVDAEGGEVEAFVGPAEAARYAAEFDRRLADFAAFFAARGIRYLPTPAERPVEELVLGLLAGEGVLG